MKKKFFCVLMALAMVLTMLPAVAVTAADETYTITWIVDGNETVHTYAMGEKIEYPEDPVKEGYTFWGWYSELNGYFVPYRMPEADLTVTAEFVEGIVYYFRHKVPISESEEGYFTMPDPLKDFETPIKNAFDEIIGYTTTQGSNTVEYQIGERVPVSAGRVFYAVDIFCEHRNETIDVIPPTCDSQGYTLRTCTICGNQSRYDYVYSLDGHDDIEGSKVVVAPTCTEPGYVTFDCARCGTYVSTYDEHVLPPTGHYYGRDDICDDCGAGKSIVVNLYDHIDWDDDEAYDYGDGWYGARVNVYMDGELLQTLSHPVGYCTTWTLPYDNLKEYTFEWTYGGDDSDVSTNAVIEIIVNDLQVYMNPDVEWCSDGDILFTIEKDCKHNFNRHGVCLICGESMQLSVSMGSTHSYAAGSIIGDSWYGSGIEVYEDGVLVGMASKYEYGVPVEVWKYPYDLTKEYTFRWVDGEYTDEEEYFDLLVDRETLYSVEPGGCTEFATGDHLFTIAEQEIRPAEADVKFQTKFNDNTADLRLVTWVDTLDYREVYFNVTIGGQTAVIPCTTVYSAINADGMALSDASAVFGEEAQYFVTYSIRNIPGAAYNEEIQVSVTWAGPDGYSVTSETRTIVLADSL